MGCYSKGRHGGAHDDLERDAARHAGAGGCVAYAGSGVCTTLVALVDYYTSVDSRTSY